MQWRVCEYVYEFILWFPPHPACEALGEKTLKTCKMTGKISKFMIFKSRFLREKILFFVQGFFPDKIWIYTFDCARFYRISVRATTFAKEPVCISKYFREISISRKYLDIQYYTHGFLGESRGLYRNTIKTCAIERIDPYLTRKKNLDEK